jgi:4-amino-4-deoxy-L-arabinose transferase-like glycosyltransferase
MIPARPAPPSSFRLEALRRTGFAADYAAVAFIGGLYLLYGLDAYGVLNNNEGLYAEMAREMLESGSFGVPTLNGVPYLEKPPLLPWLAAAASALFGPSEIALRCVPVAATAALIFATARFAAGHVRPAVGWLSGLILASSFCQLVVQRTLLPDVLLVLFFSLSMGAFYQWHRTGERRALLLSYGALGFAFLAKGFVALALGSLVFMVFGALAQRTWRMRDLAAPQALAVLALVVAPWPVWLAIKDPEYAWFFIVNEHVLRFLGLREPHDYYTGPVYYYLPRILMFLFPWSVFVPLLFVRIRQRAADMTDLEKLAWVWFGVCLVFFSASEAKANYYMTVAMPPLAFLLALRIAELVEGAGRWTFAGGALLVAAGVAASTWVIEAQLGATPPRGLWIAISRQMEYLQWSLWSVAALCLLAAVLYLRGLARPALYALALANLPLLAFFVAVMASAEPFASEREMARYIAGNHPQAQVFLYQDYEKLASLPFYLAREVPVVDSVSNDLAFGMKLSPESENFPSAGEFAQIRDTTPVVLVVHRHRLRDLLVSPAAAGLRLRHRIGNVSVFSN